MVVSPQILEKWLPLLVASLLVLPLWIWMAVRTTHCLRIITTHIIRHRSTTMPTEAASRSRALSLRSSRQQDPNNPVGRFEFAYILEEEKKRKVGQTLSGNIGWLSAWPRA
jgi:hypothetical protein